MTYKINHKIIKSSFEIAALKLCDDLYLLDATDDFSVVARRDSSRRLVLGSSFNDILDLEKRDILRSYFYNETDDPLVISTDVGVAVINKCISLSTLLLAVSFVDDESELDDVSKNTDEALEESCFYYAVPFKELNENFNKDIERLSRLSGCAVDLYLREYIFCDRSFDCSAFKGFLLSVLTLARRISKKRRARVELSSCLEGVSVRVSFDVVDGVSRDPLDYSEIAVFYAMADRNRMLFEASFEGGVMRLRFCPARKDWSLLGIKAYHEFDWSR